MNINFYYKGQTISIKADPKFDLKRIYESALSKFEPHFYQELSLFGVNLRLRSRRTNSLVNFTDTIGDRLQENDTIIIEPKENLTSPSVNMHAPRRYDLSTIDSNYPPAVFTSSDYNQTKSNINLKTKNSMKFPYNLMNKNTDNGFRYQKSEHSHVTSKNSHYQKSPFERTDLRRSLGANIAPQYDTDGYRVDTSYANYDSDSSVSDFNNFANQKLVQHHIQSRSEESKRLISMSKSAPASPTKPIPPIRSPHTHISMLNAYNVRTIGTKINISIVKKPHFGFGFTIVTRDNPVLYGSSTDITNSVVILVNKILPNGGAALDNRLRPGDRLLEMNGVQFMSHKDVMDRLRAVPDNQSANLLISRVERDENDFKDDTQQNIAKNPLSRQQITFEIPLLQNQKIKQQLGFNIHCLTETDSPSMGPGIYIHSILPNSLASQHGGLNPGDKIIGLNDRNLTDISVEETISELRSIMQSDSLLSITVCRTVTNEELHRDSPKKEHSFSLLPNKLSLDKRVTHGSGTRNYVNSSHYSSSDSLQYQPDSSYSFVRESKGRRSMSDKRKAHEDASQFSFYKQTRLGDDNISDDRLYSTLPTSSRLKKMSTTEPPCLPNKTQIPLKPSQIKHLNAPKPQAEQTNKAPKVPSRSVSLRTSPTKLNKRIPPDPTQSPKGVSLTPIYDQQQQPTFNRAMNNSFRKAVQKSLPDNEPYLAFVGSPEQSRSGHKDMTNYQLPMQKDGASLMYSGQHHRDRIPRSNSVKSPDEKKPNFNLKTFLTFTPNLTRPRLDMSKEKSNTLPLNEPPQYNMPSVNSTVKYPRYSPVQMPLEVQSFDDPIIDSTKRVLEWQMKNDDVISKENTIKEQKQYQTNVPYGTANFKNKTEINSGGIRAPATGKNINYSNTIISNDSDPYDTIDVNRLSPTGMSKPKSSHQKPSRSNSHYNVDPISPKNGVASHSNRITYQIANSHSASPNDMYATVNRLSKKENKNYKEQPFVSSQSHGNKYRF